MDSQQIADALKSASETALKVVADLQAAQKKQSDEQAKRDADEKEFRRLLNAGCTPGQAKFAMSLKLPK